MSLNLKGVSDLAAFVERHPGLMILSGAGLSTASGIPDYRDRNGLRKGNPPIFWRDFSQSSSVRQRYWARSMVGWPAVYEAKPSAGHLAIADLEIAGAIAGVITQNVDGLHNRAGSSNLIELHGNIHHVNCLGCGGQLSRQTFQATLESYNPSLRGRVISLAPDGDAHLAEISFHDFVIPGCSVCGGIIRPAVVFFGEDVPRSRVEAARERVEGAPALLVIGSSVMVYSGFRFCLLAAKLGKPIAALNLGKTRADHLFVLKVEQDCDLVLPRIRIAR